MSWHGGSPTAIRVHGNITRAVARALVLVALVVPGVHAQGAAGDSLTLAAALRLARDSSSWFRSADGRRLSQLGRAAEMSQWPNPTVEWRRENLGSPLDPDIFATLYLPVDLTGRRLALRSAGAVARQRAEREWETERREIELRVARAWVRAAAARQSTHLLRIQLASLFEVARIEAARVREGTSAEVSLLRIRIEEERTRLLAEQAAQEEARALGALRVALGWRSADSIRLPALDAPTLPQPLDEVLAVAMARRNRPEIEGAEAAVREADARLRAERRGLTGGDWQLQGGSKQTGGFMTGQIGLAIPFPIFNRNDAARLRATGERFEAHARRDEMHTAIAADVHAAFVSYRAFADRATALPALADQGEVVARSMRVAWQEGQATLLELIDAERIATDAQLMQLRWFADAWIARLDFERAIGARLDADSPLDLPLRSDAMPPAPANR